MKSTRSIKAAIRRDETIVRLDVVAGAFPMTWAADGDLYVAFSDGIDIAEPPTKAYHSRIYRVSGHPPDVGLHDLPGYPDMPMRLTESHYASFWAGSCLSVDGCLYQFLPTPNHPYLRADGTFWPDFYMASSKLIYSADGGRTWRNQDGTTPVVWEDWGAVSADNMMFFDEPPEGVFADPAFLQMGRDYAQNTDGYAYLYSINGGEDGSANQLVLARVPTGEIRRRDRYEFFAGEAAGARATWTKDISQRAPAHTFPLGWVSGRMPGAVPAGWWISATYNAPLGVYMLAASGTGAGPTGGWFGKPSYLGIWVASNPWGPFRQIHEDAAWTPAGDPDSRAFQPQIASKWISEDGTSFWLGWSDYGTKQDGMADGEFNPDKVSLEALKHLTDDAAFAQALKVRMKRKVAACLSLQRVDLVIDEGA